MMTSTSSVSKPSGDRPTRIDVALGTLDDSIVDLYDTDWSFLDTNDDYGGYHCLAPLLGSSQFRRALRCGVWLRHRDLHADGVPCPPRLTGDTTEHATVYSYRRDPRRPLSSLVYNVTEAGSWDHTWTG